MDETEFFVKHASDSTIIDLEEDGGPRKAPRPRGHKAGKQDLQREASSISLKYTLKVVMANKEEASAKREESRRQEKEDQMTNFAKIQRKALEMQERKLVLQEEYAGKIKGDLMSNKINLRPQCLLRESDHDGRLTPLVAGNKGLV
jgi:hypothetical protein